MDLYGIIKEMMYILGIITGICLSILTLVVSLIFKTPLERTINQIGSRVKEKGKILEPENEEIKKWVEELKNE
ncbi:MAG: hypothetical protein AAB706_00915 [Patescibacteria group bacterium]